MMFSSLLLWCAPLSLGTKPIFLAVAVPPFPKTVCWYNKEGRVEANDKYKIIEDGSGGYMIEIKPSESCDGGEWKCVVTSDEGSVGISTAMVKMESKSLYNKKETLRKYYAFQYRETSGNHDLWKVLKQF